MKPPEDFTTSDLEQLMREYLEKRGMSADFVRGYIEAQRKSGWLRDRSPAWVRNSAALFYLIPVSEARRPSTKTKP